MKFSEAIEQLRAARAAHKAWVSRAEALVEGIPLEQNQVPMFPTDCAFGKWYYGPGQQLSKVAGFKEMETPHDALHKVYRKIFKLLIEEPNSSALGRLFGKARKAKAKQVEQAAALLPELRDLSDQMTYLLENVENSLNNLAKRKHAKPVPSNDVIDLLEKMEKVTL